MFLGDVYPWARVAWFENHWHRSSEENDHFRRRTAYDRKTEFDILFSWHETSKRPSQGIFLLSVPTPLALPYCTAGAWGSAVTA